MKWRYQVSWEYPGTYLMGTCEVGPRYLVDALVTVLTKTGHSVTVIDRRDEEASRRRRRPPREHAA